MLKNRGSHVNKIRKCVNLWCTNVNYELCTTFQAF